MSVGVKLLFVGVRMLFVGLKLLEASPSLLYPPPPHSLHRFLNSTNACSLNSGVLFMDVSSHKHCRVFSGCLPSSSRLSPFINQACVDVFVRVHVLSCSGVIPVTTFASSKLSLLICMRCVETCAGTVVIARAVR